MSIACSNVPVASTPKKGAEDVSPLVSVIIPAFNAEMTLVRTLESVAAQEHRNLEILIVDDGSTDSTNAIAARFRDREPRARLLVKTNGGVASARNLGLAEARGEFVAPIDADDLWHPEKIARQVAVARSAAEPPGFVYCWFRDIDAADRVWRDGSPLAVRGAALQRLAYLNFVGNGSSPLFSREALLSVGGYDERLRHSGTEGCEDLLAQLAVARLYPVALVPQYLVGYRLTHRSMSSEAGRMYRSWRKAMELLEGEPAISRQAIRWNEGARALALAESSAMQGELATSILQLCRAFRLDPLRTGLHLLWRSARRFGRPASIMRTERRSFDDHDSKLPSPVTDVWLKRMARFDQRRLDRFKDRERQPASIPALSHMPACSAPIALGAE